MRLLMKILSHLLVVVLFTVSGCHIVDADSQNKSYNIRVKPEVYRGFGKITKPPVDPNTPWNLACFEKKGLIDILKRLVDKQQLIRNDLMQTVSMNKLNKKGCAFQQIPYGSKSYRAGIYKNKKEGLIYPLFVFKASSTGAVMYGVDAVFEEKDWFVTDWCNQGYNELSMSCIVPKNCEALFRFVTFSGKTHPDYLYIPRDCKPYFVGGEPDYMYDNKYKQRDNGYGRKGNYDSDGTFYPFSKEQLKSQEIWFGK